MRSPRSRLNRQRKRQRKQGRSLSRLRIRAELVAGQRAVTPLMIDSTWWPGHRICRLFWVLQYDRIDYYDQRFIRDISLGTVRMYIVYSLKAAVLVVVVVSFSVNSYC